MNHFLKIISSLPRYTKQAMAMLSDASLCVISVWFGLYLRLDYFVTLQDNILITTIISILLAIPIFWSFGLYRTLFRYSGKSVIISIASAITIYGLLFFSIFTVYSFDEVPRSIGVIQPLILFFFISGSRLLVRLFLGQNFQKKISTISSNALVYGAGEAGRQLVSALENSNKIAVEAFVDDNKSFHKKMLLGKMIYSTDNLEKLIKKKNISHILIAIPSANRKRRQEIFEKLSKYKLKIKTLPSISDLVDGKVTITDIKEPDINDILSRDTVSPDEKLLKKNVESKTVLVSGAGGSIGSELSRQIFRLNPRKLLLLDISEYGLYKITSELEELKNKNISYKNIELVSLVSSILDENRINHIINLYKPETLYHAAAYKHVPLVEENISVGVKNNVLGTLILAKIAIENGVNNFVFISSDKAVRPTNVMGASKRLAEICLKSIFNQRGFSKKLSIVRFGNVLDSSGSIIPKIKKQIQRGGPLTLTHPDVTRFFMTIPEAAQLVIQAGSLKSDSNVFILNMGKAIKIKDLMIKHINLSGLTLQSDKNPDGDIAIEIIGLRPGEKLHEELLLSKKPEDTEHPMIMKSDEPCVPWQELSINIEKLKLLICENNTKLIKNLLKSLIPDYIIYDKSVDKLFNLQKKNS